MPFALSLAAAAGLVVGSCAAAISDIFPAYRLTLQNWGGGLLVGSFALLGLAFPMI